MVTRKTSNYIPELKEVKTLGDVSISLSHVDVPIVAEALVSKEQLWDDDHYIDNEIKDFSETNAEEAYEKSPLYILQLLHEYADVLRGYRDTALERVAHAEAFIALIERHKYNTEDEKKAKLKEAKAILKARKDVLKGFNQKIETCEGWNVDDINVCLGE